MSGLAFQQATPQQKAPGTAGAILAEAWRLYTRLFMRTFLMAIVVFGAVNLLRALLRAGHGGLTAAVLTLAATVFGTTLLQGGLVEVVRGLHEDGDDEATAFEALARASAKLWKLIRLAMLMALGIGLASLLFVVPGIVLATRWGLAVPIAMLEEGTARDALGRSRTLVRGNGWNVFKARLGASLLTFVITIPFGLLAPGMDVVAFWVAATIVSALAAPYTAHVFTVAYYALREPGRPVALEPGERWGSVWEEQQQQPAATTDSAWAEYERKFDERWNT